MNRIIKFRYWNTISNIMVNNPEMPYKKGWTIEQLFSERGWIWMQFTGLLDKNGKEIYEGDILHITTKDMVNLNYRTIVEWSSQGFYKEFTNFDKAEVVGNIYENSLLINTKK